jgi:hypothetical protein
MIYMIRMLHTQSASWALEPHYKYIPNQWRNIYRTRKKDMPEGPCIVILKELILPFKGKRKQCTFFVTVAR